MVGQFKVMIGQQQDATILLHTHITGFGAWHAWGQPAVARTHGKIARQAHHAATIVAKALSRTALLIEQG
ncbi:hypothetical protein D3C87_2055830 [compost metagenome]